MRMVRELPSLSPRSEGPREGLVYLGRSPKTHLVCCKDELPSG